MNTRDKTRWLICGAILISMTHSFSCKDENNSIVGNPSLPAEVQIIGLNAGDSEVRGIANNIDVSKIRVVLWAKTDIWYVQPFIATPYTAIGSDGSWKNSTHPWNRMVALLVDERYSPGSIRTYHPSSDVGVLAWDEKPEKRPDRIVDFSGYRFRVKVAETNAAGPGPNYFSDSTSNVWIDTLGLHLKIQNRNGKWFCSEVFADGSRGYGEYQFQLAARVDSLDSRTVASGFVYETDSREIDIEFSTALVAPNNAQFVVQPYNHFGNIRTFKMPAVQNSSHRFLWTRNSIAFSSWRGFGQFPPHPDSIIQSWLYKGVDIPPPGNELMRFNLWLFQGLPPSSGTGDEMIIKSFRYQP